jgi:hypothetical protein
MARTRKHVLLVPIDLEFEVEAEFEFDPGFPGSREEPPEPKGWFFNGVSNYDEKAACELLAEEIWRKLQDLEADGLIAEYIQDMH